MLNDIVYPLLFREMDSISFLPLMLISCYTFGGLIYAWYAFAILKPDDRVEKKFVIPNASSQTKKKKKE